MKNTFSNVRASVSSKIVRAFQRVKAVWSFSGQSLRYLQASSLARWGRLDYISLAVKAIQNPYAFRAISLIAEMFASVPLVIKRTANEEVEFDKTHELLTLLARPDRSSKISRLQMFCMMVWHLHFGGEIFLRKLSPETGRNAGRPMRLKLLRPDRVTDINYDELDDVVSYKYQTRRGRNTTIPAEDVLHVMLYNPTTQVNEDERGLPIVVACIRAIELMREGEDWNKSIAQQKGRLPGFFKRTEKGTISDEKRLELREEVHNIWRQNAKESLPMLLPFGWNFEQMAMNLKDADWSESDKANMRKIAVALGVDPALLGDNQNRTVNNMREAVTALLTLRVLPLLDFVLDSCTVWFRDLGMIAAEEELAYDPNSIGPLKEELTARWERTLLATDKGVLELDEARSELGFKPIGGASARQYMPINRIPIDEAGMSGGSTPDDLEMSEIVREIRKHSQDAFDQLLDGIRSNGIH